MADNFKSGKTDMEENPINEMTKKLSGLQMSELGESGSQAARIREFGLLTEMKATENFLNENPDFINETTALALLKWCSTCAQNQDEFNVVSTQTLYVLYLLDLARQVEIDPGYCVAPFFARISEPEFYEMFEKEIIPFRERLQSSSWDEVFEEVLNGNSTDDDSSLSISSSGADSITLDPLEIYKDLPPKLKECIDNEDIDALEAALNELPEDVAADYMSLFLKLGLFVPIDSKGDSDSGSEEVEKELVTQEFEDD